MKQIQFGSRQKRLRMKGMHGCMHERGNYVINVRTILLNNQGRLNCCDCVHVEEVEVERIEEEHIVEDTLVLGRVVEDILVAVDNLVVDIPVADILVVDTLAVDNLAVDTLEVDILVEDVLPLHQMVDNLFIINKSWDWLRNVKWIKQTKQSIMITYVPWGGGTPTGGCCWLYWLIGGDDGCYCGWVDGDN